MAQPTPNITGIRFGHLLVLCRHETLPRGKRDAWWLCRCDCGKEKPVRSTCLRRGTTKTCGCAYRRWPNSLRHGHGRRGQQSAEFKAWCGMRQRCSNPKDPGWKNYGGRDISVCTQWKDSFEQFFADVGRKPSPSHSLDRINNDGDYEPQNCRWATAAEQNRNTRMKRIEQFTNDALRAEIIRRGWELK